MKYLIYNTKAEAVLKNTEITNKCINDGVWIDGVTNNYCTPLKHPINRQWAIVIQSGYEGYFTEEDLSISTGLDETWKNK